MSFSFEKTPGGRAALFVCALVAAAGCKKEEAPAPQESTQEPTAALDPAPPGPPETGLELAPDEPKTPLGRVPTPEDLEDEAAQTIALDNLEAELDRLEAEIIGGS